MRVMSDDLFPLAASRPPTPKPRHVWARVGVRSRVVCGRACVSGAEGTVLSSLSFSPLSFDTCIIGRGITMGLLTR